MNNGKQENKKWDEIRFKDFENTNTAEKLKFSFGNVLLFSYLHLVAFKGLLLCITSAKLATVIFGKLL